MQHFIYFKYNLSNSCERQPCRKYQELNWSSGSMQLVLVLFQQRGWKSQERDPAGTPKRGFV